MEKLLRDPELIWATIGLVIFFLEFVIPGYIMLFIALGMWITAVGSMIFDLTFNSQIILFLISSIITMILFRKTYKNKIKKIKKA